MREGIKFGEHGAEENSRDKLLAKPTGLTLG